MWNLALSYFIVTLVHSTVQRSPSKMSTPSSFTSRSNNLDLQFNASLSPLQLRHSASHAPNESHSTMASQYGHNIDIRRHHKPIGNHPCSLKLPLGCACTKLNGALSLQCSRAMLTVIPRTWNSDIGPALVRTMNLERNNITAIRDGDFFGLKIERLILAYNLLRRLEFLAFWGLEYNLQTLDLGHNRFDQLPSDALRLLQNLRSLTLTGNRITSLRDFDFGPLRKLEMLALDNNPLVAVGTKIFSGTRLFFVSLARVQLSTGLSYVNTADMKQLKGLSLAHNRIDNVGKDWFENMKSLWYLNLADNRLTDLPRNDTFSGLERSLINFDLSGNQFHTVPIYAVRSLRRLETLDFSRNRIDKLSDELCQLASLVTLHTLNFSSNRIKKISATAFDGLSAQIRVIDLRNNRLSTLDEMTFSRLNSNGLHPVTQATRVDIFLSGNRWLCNCLLKWLRQIIKQQHQQQQQQEQSHYKQMQHQNILQHNYPTVLPSTNERLLMTDGDAMICDRPHYLAGLAFTKAAARDFTCQNDYYYYYEQSNDDDEENIESSGAMAQY